MEKIMIVNGSPRYNVSNSKKLSELFKKFNTKFQINEFVCNKDNGKICENIENVNHILFIFPLYTDGVPAILLNLFKDIKNFNNKNKPKVHVIINCGFFEPFQNDTAVQIVKIFSEQCGFEFGSVLRIGSGEAILSTPFKYMVYMKLKAFLKSILNNKNLNLKVTMPITKSMFLKASTTYWINKGKKFNNTYEDMNIMDIEK